MDDCNLFLKKTTTRNILSAFLCFIVFSHLYIVNWIETSPHGVINCLASCKKNLFVESKLVHRKIFFPGHIPNTAEIRL